MDKNVKNVNLYMKLQAATWRGERLLGTYTRK